MNKGNHGKRKNLKVILLLLLLLLSSLSSFLDDKNKSITKKDNKRDTDDLRHTYKILCLDGGGVRGILTTNLLTRICEHDPKFMENVDLICGTSAGGILSLLLASGYTLKECNEIYSFAAPHIFAHNPWYTIVTLNQY